MMEKPVLSIVIPCYNSFHLMKKCLKSLQNQGNHELEVIIVDDCSTDNSYKCLLDYAHESKMNIHVFKNEVNSGPGITRNNGIQKATGDYITFLDADDYFSDSFYEIVKPILRTHIDCVIFDSNIVRNDVILSRLGMIEKHGIKSGDVCTNSAIVYTRGATCGKIYRLNIIRDHNIHFLDMKRCEDIPFTKCALACCKNILYLTEPLYNYVQHEESLMHDPKLSDPSNAQKAFEYIENQIKDIYPDETEALFARQYLVSTVLTNLKKMNRRELLNYIREAEALYPDYLNNVYLKQFPLHVKITLNLIHMHCWSGLKALAFVKGKIESCRR